MPASEAVKSNKLTRKHNNRMWAEKRLTTSGGKAVAGGSAGTPATPLDVSKAIYRPGTPTPFVVPAGGKVIIPFSGWENSFLTALYHSLSGGTFSGWTTDANYLFEVSIKGSIPSGGSQIGVEVWVDSGYYQEIICTSVSTVDERHNGQTAIHVVRNPSTSIKIYLTDPGGGGVTFNLSEAYCDISLGNRR